MNPQTHTETEYLDLLNKTEAEIDSYLTSFGIVKHIDIECNNCSDVQYIPEPLPVLAGRLWKMAVEKAGISILTDSMLLVSNHPSRLFKACTGQEYFLYHSLSIDEIVAALIALRRAGVKEI